MVTQDEFRAAMAQFGAAVSIVTTGGPEGRHGMTVSAVCSVTDAPPTLLVCINRQSAGNAAIKGNGVLAVNVLSARQQDIALRFSQREIPTAARFEAGAWKLGDTGSPLLLDAAAMLDCHVVEATEVGSHSVFFCNVRSATVLTEAGCLIYHARSYHDIGGPIPVGEAGH
ncbi:MAG: Flavin reductase-like, FMN-binding [Bradyrhizobium sp.]|jgi:flavin reductase|nr:Flavin reductase-like, FMN-binding [Bradyrhizobium sp.]